VSERLEAPLEVVAELAAAPVVAAVVVAVIADLVVAELATGVPSSTLWWWSPSSPR
jgi:hypothetical protein